MTVQSQPVVLTSELPGRTCGYLVAEIRPQINGLILKRHFTEGSQVKTDQVLYQIDPAPYQAAFDNSTANLQAVRKAADRAKADLTTSIASLKRYQATLKLAKMNLRRYEDLVKVHAVSNMDRDQGETDVEVAESALRTAEAQVESNRQGEEAAKAAIKQAEAALETAKINLGYTKITAPISGRIGRSNVTEGAIATAYQAVPLATIQQLDPIYVDVPQSTTEVNRLRRSLANGRLKENGTDRVKILLEDGTAYPQEGSLKFRDVTVDPTTGSVILRIVVPNPEGILLPGMFVRAIVDEGISEHAILIPQQAVSRDPKGNPTALVVDAQGTVQQRSITTDRALGDKWLVSSGLAQGERVIVEGIQKAHPGATVSVTPFEAARTNAAKPASTTQTTLH
jgi:membrane fusion protein (multidrug efflux system)